MHTFADGSFWGVTPFIGLSVLGIIGMVAGALAVLAVIVLKGYALWHAAKRDDKWWFAFMLIINTVGILELIYVIFVVKKWHHRFKRHSH